MDNILSLNVQPQPQSLVRTFVGRVEIFLDTEEQKFLKDIQTKKEEFKIETLGRFAESKLSRLEALTTNPAELELIRRFGRTIH